MPKASGEFPLHSRTVAPYSPIKIPLLEEGDYYLVRFYREDGYAVGTTFSSEDAEKKVLTVPAPALFEKAGFEVSRRARETGVAGGQEPVRSGADAVILPAPVQR